MRPRIRTLKPEFFSDERICAVSRDARLLAVGLMEGADDRGRIEDSIPAIRGFVFPRDQDVTDKKVKGWLGELVRTGFAVRYEHAGWSYLWLPTFMRHQLVNRPTESKLPAHPDDQWAHLQIRDAFRVAHDNPPVLTTNAVSPHDKCSDDSVSAHDKCVEGSQPRAQTRVPTFPVPCSVPVVSSLQPASNPSSIQSKTNQVQGRTARGRETMRPSRDVLALCNRLASLISLNDPKADPQSRSERWLTDMRLLLADRDGDIEEVRAVIEWCQRDSFWRSNILSPGKLRKQFTQLKLRMDGDDNGGQGGARRLPTPRPESPSEMLIALNGGQI